MSVCPSVRPSACIEQICSCLTDIHEISYLSIFFFFSKICEENSSLIKIWQEWLVLYMNANIHFLSYLAHFSLDWDPYQTKAIEKIKTHLRSITFFLSRNSCLSWDNVEKYCRGHATDEKIWCMLIASRCYVIVHCLSCWFLGRVARMLQWNYGWHIYDCRALICWCWQGKWLAEMLGEEPIECHFVSNTTCVVLAANPGIGD